MTDLLALAAECEKAEGPSRGLDRKIFEATTGLSASHWLPGFTGGSLIRHMDTPRYSDSIDAALTLYKVVPARIPSNPLAVCVEALRQWK